MRYFKEFDEAGKLIAFGAGSALNGIEITKEEYEQIANEHQEKFELSVKLYRSEISIEDVPDVWKEEVQEKTNQHIKRLGAFDPEKITSDEAIDIITGVTE